MRALLAEGTDADQRAGGGQTALMLAAIFDHVDIARLLLAVGADVRLQDNLGLTAREWAVRRGSSKVAQLLSNASPAEIVPSPKNLPAKQAPPKVEAERRNPAAEAKTTPHQDALSGTEEQQRTKPDPQRREAEQERRASATETKIAPQHDARRWINGQKRIIADQERRKAEETRRAPATETKIGSQQDAPSGTEEQQRTNAEPQRREVEEARRSSPIETKIAPQQDAPNVADEQQRTKPDPQRREVEEARRASPIETKIAPQQDVPNVADEQQRTKAEPERRKAEEARPTPTRSPTIAARIEHLRILEESRQRVEAEVRAKSQRAARPAVERGQRGIPSGAALGPRPSISAGATRLISADDPLFNDWARPTLWALVAIIAVGGGSIGYLINNYLSREKGSSAPIAAQMEQPENARKDLPMIDGALSGMEVNVPEPEYPAKAKTEGVSGTVTVQVQVNKKGRVISARSSRGDWRLRAAAVKAAQKATFSAEKLAGRGAIGTITYVFRL